MDAARREGVRVRAGDRCEYCRVGQEHVLNRVNGMRALLLALLIASCGRLESGADSSAPVDAASVSGGGDAGLARGDGFACEGSEWCTPGMACVDCWQTSATNLICVPHPDHDPPGFLEATRECGRSDGWVECDGAEDCAEGEYCTFEPVDPSLPNYWETFRNGQCRLRTMLCETSGCARCNDDSDCLNGWRCTQLDRLGWDSQPLWGCVPG